MYGLQSAILKPECVSLVYPPMMIMLNIPAAVTNSQLPTNFYLPGFTNYCAYWYFVKLCLNKAEAAGLKNELIPFLTNIFVSIFILIWVNFNFKNLLY